MRVFEEIREFCDTVQLVAYTYQEKKPSLNLYPDDLAALPATIF